MLKYLTSKFVAASENRWMKGDDRTADLAVLDALLDGELYDVLAYPFYQETTHGDFGEYVPILERRPSFRFNLYGMLTSQVARKTWAGDRAPRIVQKKRAVKKAMTSIRTECEFDKHMMEITKWGSVGSACTYFQLVPFLDDTGKARTKVVLTNVRSKDCTPTFNKLKELQRLLIHYPVTGAELLSSEKPVSVDVQGKPIKGDSQYWHVMEFTTTEEITYHPIPLSKWSPIKGKLDKFFATCLEKFEHKLGYVPAHWFQIGTGKNRKYDGACYWKDATANIFDIDWTVSRVGSGIRYNSIPQAVIKGQVVNPTTDGGLGRGASQFIQLKADIKMGEDEEKNSHAFMLEANGNAMKVGIEIWAPFVLRLALQQIAASVKDPNKITTAPSGKSLEVLDSEFLDLGRENRTVFGDDGALKLFKKILAACVLKKHALAGPMTIEDIDGISWTWPQLTSLSMTDLQAMANALKEMIEAHIMNDQEARDFAYSQIDMPQENAALDYIAAVDASQDNNPGPLVPSETSEDSISEATAKVAASALKKAQEPPATSNFPIIPA